jgi:hypothetical protein
MACVVERDVLWDQSGSSEPRYIFQGMAGSMEV